VLLNRLWMVETLEKRGSPNCGICLLRKWIVKTLVHLFTHCRYTIII
jgi:hypothetical protein